jgi:hypothetical protein
VRKIIAPVLALSLALGACGGASNIPSVITNIVDTVGQISRGLCQLAPTAATIDAIIKAMGGTPVASQIAGFFCANVQQLRQTTIPKFVKSPDGQVVRYFGDAKIGNTLVPLYGTK